MPIKILTIDDDPTLTELFIATMTTRGFDVISANSGTEGLLKIKTESPDIVVLDLIMPDRDGWEVCQAIRAARKYLPIIILSALSDSGMIVAALDAGADDFLSKPVTDNILAARIKTLIRRASAENLARPTNSEKTTKPLTLHS